MGCWEQQMGDAAARAWLWPVADFESRCPLAAFVHICCGQALKKDWNCTFGVCGLVLVRLGRTAGSFPWLFSKGKCWHHVE